METQIKVGENVLFLESAAADIKSHGKDLLLVQENSILGTF
jgi:co-chaperonin GroES (HSP10)